MSNFTGVTFAKQRITPSDDAIIRRAILPDGKLTGCEISYSGSTLTMSAGQLMVCGRQIRHPSSENWSVVDATSGYARLVLTIDLTRTATKETFDQVTTAVEYASAVNGFVDLEQSDINTAGVRYQVVICVVSLGSGGITGIVSELEKSAVDGSGALNFNVVGGLTQPADPKENTIWVRTSTNVSSWTLAASAPSPPESGMVWIEISLSGANAFNALKKNGIVLCPASAWQYLNGEWTELTAKIYQGGVWENWFTYLYNKGDECTALTGGWTAYAYKTSGSNSTATKPTATEGSTSISLSLSADKAGALFTEKAVDLTNVSTLEIDVTDIAAPSSAPSVFFAVSTTKANNYSFATRVANPAKGTNSLDVSSLTGSYYVVVSLQGSGSKSIEFESIRMR